MTDNETEKEEIVKLGPPEDEKIDNPFFAYGIFKPGQLGFSQIKRVKDKYSKTMTIPYKMYYRDGIPLIDDKTTKFSETKGNIIYFTNKEEAYKIIGNAEPNKLYKWGVIKINDDPVNVLFGIDPTNGSYEDDYDCSCYDFRNDYYFTVAMKIVKDFIDKDIEIGMDGEEFFQYQMHYTLLWSIIERYGSFKYGKSTIATNNSKISSNKTFKKELKQQIHRTESKYKIRRSNDVVYASNNHEDWELDKNSYSSMKYYYTVRSNLVHRGKSQSFDDKQRIRHSLRELYYAFKAVLDEDIAGQNLK